MGFDALNEGVEEPTLPVATFKDTRIVNVQSNETPADGGVALCHCAQVWHLERWRPHLWGLDNAQMRMAFDYGITDEKAGRGRQQRPTRKRTKPTSKQGW